MEVTFPKDQSGRGFVKRLIEGKKKTSENRRRLRERSLKSVGLGRKARARCGNSKNSIFLSLRVHRT